MDEGFSAWRRRASEGTAATSAGPSKSSKVTNIEIAAVVLVVIIAISGLYYYADVYKKSSPANYGVIIHVEIAGYFHPNSTYSLAGSYYPGGMGTNFTVALGDHVNMIVTNEDNLTHGLAVPQFNVDTGPLSPDKSVTLSFVATPVGNYTMTEPKADCGGGNCDSNSTMADYTGWFLVVGNSTGS